MTCTARAPARMSPPEKPPVQSGRGVPPGKAPAPGKAPPPKAKAKAAAGYRPGGGSKEPGLTVDGRLNGVSAENPEVQAPRLRPLFWTAVTQVPTESIWSELVPPAPFNQAQLEKRFALAEPRSQVSIKKGLPGSADEPRKRLRVLDDRTSQRLAIAFNRLPPPDQLAAVVDTLDNFPDGLPEEAVLALHMAASEQKEAVEQLRQLDVMDFMQLDVPERYLWVVITRPVCAAKLACGALIVGPARELEDWQEACMRVRSCLEAFRRCTLIQKCISTSLAVGNVVNRGTSRSGATAVVLPDALVKMEELRGVNSEEAAPDAKGPSLLDFVAQALVDEAAGKKSPQDLKAEADALRLKVREAQNVCLDEAEANCRMIAAQAQKAAQGLSQLSECNNITHLALRVNNIREEAEKVSELATSGKQELEKVQQWSSAKAKTKGSDWFTAWGQFLDSLSTAFGRAKAVPPPEPPPSVAPVVPVSVPRKPLADVSNQVGPREEGTKKPDFTASQPDFAAVDPFSIELEKCVARVTAAMTPEKAARTKTPTRAPMHKPEAFLQQPQPAKAAPPAALRPNLGALAVSMPRMETKPPSHPPPLRQVLAPSPPPRAPTPQKQPTSAAVDQANRRDPIFVADDDARIEDLQELFRLGPAGAAKAAAPAATMHMPLSADPSRLACRTPTYHSVAVPAAPALGSRSYQFQSEYVRVRPETRVPLMYPETYRRQ